MTLSDSLGIFGAITGFIGAVMGYVSLRRTDQFKALDLRLDLRRAESSLSLNVNALLARMDEAKYAFDHLAAAKGSSQAGGTKEWVEKWRVDVEEVKTIQGEVAKLPADYSSLSNSDLEGRLVRVHTLQQQSDELALKYKKPG